MKEDYRALLGIERPSRKREEEQLQRSLVEHLRYFAKPEVIWFHTPNGEARSKATAGRLKAMGVQAGVLDLTFIVSRDAMGPEWPSVHFLELKSRDGVLTKAQKDFIRRAEALGCPCFVTADLDQALDVLVSWGVFTKDPRSFE